MRRQVKRRRVMLAVAGALAFLIGLLSTIRSAPAQQSRHITAVYARE
jgi:hypothetical protein